MEQIINTVTGWLEQFGYLAVYVLAAVDNFGVPAAGDIVLLAASAIAAESDQLTWRLVVLFGFLGGMTADNASYALGRFGARPIVKRFMPKRIVDGVQHGLDEHAWKTIMTARMIAGLRAAVPLLAGTSRVRYRRFVIFNTMGVAIWAVSVGTLGYFFARSLPEVARHVQQGSRVLAVIVVALLVFVAIVAVIRRRRRAGTIGES